MSAIDDDGLRERFSALRAKAVAAHPDIVIDEDVFARELVRRIGNVTPETIAAVRAPDVHLAIACLAGDEEALRQFKTILFEEIEMCGARVRASRAQIDEIRSHMLALLCIDDGERRAALHAYSGRGDLRSYIRVIATRELIRVIDAARREVLSPNESLLDHLASVTDVEAGYIRDAYRPHLDAAMRVALASLADEPRALLRYSLIDGWSMGRIATLYGVHKATAARRCAAARDQLGEAIRAELSKRLVIPMHEVDSVVRLVQSRIDVSLSRLLAKESDS